MEKPEYSQFPVLVVDDEQDNLDAFRFAFRKTFQIHYALGPTEALAMLAEVAPAVVVADQRMPEMSGIELLREVKKRHPGSFTILLTAYADLSVLIEAVNTGAVDRYVPKPWDSKEFAVTLRQAISHHITIEENRRMREQLAEYAGYLEAKQRDPIDFGQLVGGGEATQAVLSRVEEVADTDSVVTIEGETGLEKEVVARALHVGSGREHRPFVSVTCAAFRPDALERELFGHSKGAFEGAYQERPGRIELADGGTLYLHEVSELSVQTQARFLSWLTDGRVERVFGTSQRRVNVRLVLSVTPSAQSVFGGGKLLPELEARLTVFPIRLTPLRERQAEISALAQHFVQAYASRNARAATQLDGDAIKALSKYHWPGNLRELENVVERAAILARGQTIGAEHLSFRDPLRIESTPPADAREGVTLGKKLDDIERNELLRALDKYKGNKAEVARALGIHRTTLYYRLKKLGIHA